MSRLTRDGTAEPVSRDQILRHAREQGNIKFPCSADHEQDWPPYPVDPYSAICDDHTYILCCERAFVIFRGVKEGAGKRIQTMPTILFSSSTFLRTLNFGLSFQTGIGSGNLLTTGPLSYYLIVLNSVIV